MLVVAWFTVRPSSGPWTWLIEPQGTPGSSLPFLLVPEGLPSSSQGQQCSAPFPPHHLIYSHA